MNVGRVVDGVGDTNGEISDRGPREPLVSNSRQRYSAHLNGEQHDGVGHAGYHDAAGDYYSVHEIVHSGSIPILGISPGTTVWR